MALPLQAEEVRHLVDHIFLPSQLPQKEDELSELALVNFTLAALEGFQTSLGDHCEAIDDAVHLVTQLKGYQGANGAVDEMALDRALISLQPGQTLAVKVSAQNAAVMVTHLGDKLLFEGFELSPQNTAVFSTKGRLVRTFPAVALTLDIGLLAEGDFTETIAKTLATMAHQRVPEMVPKSKKSNQAHEEDRDTASPAVVTEMFFGMLRGFGQPCSAISGVSKRMREEVLWKNARRPWRRSTMWLLIRVALQLTIGRSKGGSDLLYKNAMLFLMARLLSAALQAELPSDTLHVMMAKIDRRRQKLLCTSSLQEAVRQSVEQQLRESHAVISRRWKSIQSSSTHTVSESMRSLPELDFSNDALVALPGVDQYVAGLKSRQSSTNGTDFQPKTGLLRKSQDQLPPLPGRPGDAYAVQNLRQFEQFVSQDLNDWIARRDANVVCRTLCEAIKAYHSVANAVYAKNPEGVSLMMLTLMEMWVACDGAAARCTLLQGYSIGFDEPIITLRNLLLPFSEQMHRLSDVEAYLLRRSAGFESQKLFDLSDPAGFPNRYYAMSQEHKALHEVILTAAERGRRAKIEELKKSKAEYERLDELYNSGSCDIIAEEIERLNEPPETVTRHNPFCMRCSSRTQRDGIEITVHEWPLPESTTKAKGVVFELKVPDWFAYWRDARQFLLHAVFKGTCTTLNPAISYSPSSNDPHLKPNFKTVRHRIGLLSQAKPLIKSHFRGKDVATSTQSTVCVLNGLKYDYYDSETQSLLLDLKYAKHIENACTFRLHKAAQSLQKFVGRQEDSPTGVSPNFVFASQHECPKNMSLEEFKDLASLPLGHQIQWSNLLLQLRMPSIDFKKLESHLVILQCIYHAGPSASDSIARQAHKIMSNGRIAILAMETLEVALGRIKGNWESVQALSTFVAIAARILSLQDSSADEASRSGGLNFLSKARAVAVTWMDALREKASAVSGDSLVRKEFGAKAIEIALVCCSTFDIDEQYLEAILSTPDASFLVRASIIVHEGRHNSIFQLPHIARLYFRSQRLLHRAHTLLARNSTSINAAVLASWSAFRPDPAGWSLLCDHWLTIETAPITASTAITRVHYNLLTGELLVNGLPISQPPKKYCDDALYGHLFGDATVEVMPTSEPGFQFSTRRSFAGGSVLLGMNDSRLYVRASGLDGTYETAPIGLLRNNYPKQFLDNFILWYKDADGLFELRPVNDPWNSKSALKWTLTQDVPFTSPSLATAATKIIKSAFRLPILETSKPLWRLERYGACMLGLASKTSKLFDDILHPLAVASEVHCLARSDHSLLVELPSLRLAFTLQSNSSSVQSREYPLMEIDSDQSLGTLVGFTNKLMMKCQAGSERMALVLQNEVHYNELRSHISVSVSSQGKSKVHAVRLDNALHRLLDNDDIGCKFYLAYLHALTSFCLPDPATLKTGTEQALTILRSQAVASFTQLSQEDVNMLDRIRKLSPVRSFYPSYERVMQTVTWGDRLSFLSQHEDLATAASALLRQAESAKIFYPDQPLKIPKLDGVQDDLRVRACIRDSTFRTAGFGAENHTPCHDITYDARDMGIDSVRAKNVTTLSALVCRDGTARIGAPPATWNLWQKLCKLGQLQGANSEVSVADLRYDAALLRTEMTPCVAKLLALLRWLNRQQKSPHRHKFATLVWLSTLAFANETDLSQQTLQLLAMCFKSPRLVITAPQTVSFNLTLGHTFGHNQLVKILNQRENLRSYEACPSYSSNAQNLDETARKKAWQTTKDAMVVKLVSSLMAQWPTTSPDAPNVAEADTYVYVYHAMGAIEDLFQAWHDNDALWRFLDDLGRTMDSHVFQPVGLLPSLQVNSEIRESKKGFISEADLFLVMPPALPVPPELETPRQYIEAQLSEMTHEAREPRLKALYGRMHQAVQAQSGHERDYVKDLGRSLSALTSSSHYLVASDTASAAPSLLRLRPNHAEGLANYLQACEDHAHGIYKALLKALTSSGKAEVAYDIQHFPRVSPPLLLKQLARDRWPLLSRVWRKCIVQYGLALTAVRRARRLVTLSKTDRTEDLVAELRNVGHTNWDPLQHPETLLIEVESDLMVREVQEQIAAEMRQPSSGHSSMMQLNMGEGKSSVIVPLVASHLADGSQLVRVVVAKPQSKQMAQMLVSKLGGLVGRRIYFMPFARSLQPTQKEMQIISDMLRDCMRNGGILLVQPEHILSFKLLAPETIINGNQTLAQSVMATQRFLQRNSRDIVDESDENFSPKFELIYTMGTQRPVEASSGRWFLMQQVFDLVKRSAPVIARELPSAIEVIDGASGSFPRTRILAPEGADMLTLRIAEEICESGLESFAINRQTSQIREAVYQYITCISPPAADVDIVESSQMWTESNRPHLLILRGLFAEGILSFIFGQKRWRVNYGLTDRVPSVRVAVPYRAKDTPTLRSEFSHPDVVIALTLMSYYYGGLTDDDLFAAFGHLTESDQADISYQEWVQDSMDLPSAYLTLNGVNLKDRYQCTSVTFPALRYGKSVVDYFLSHLVFPKEMKEFPHKLSASGWDLVTSRDKLTTGFSGTIDSRHVLPFGVEHVELPEQKHTNALVLECLLQPDNGVQLMPAKSQTTTDAHCLLSVILGLNPPVQVILDVGAQVLELDNRAMAEAWLKLHDESKEAVVFVDEADEVCVIDRSGRVDRLGTSLYQSRLGSCLVFLDEAHTRGIDIVLPANYRAAVTLGPRLTKDRLVQACMRMRKLGKGQTVVFCVSVEIQTHIRKLLALDECIAITVADVLEWSMRETLTDLQRNIPLWAVQGQRSMRQKRIWDAAQTQSGRLALTKETANKLLEIEAQSLEDRYRPRADSKAAKIFDSDKSWDTRRIVSRCEAFGVTQFKTSALQEEQERELSPEMEQERHAQPTPVGQLQGHPQLHPDVKQFALTGEYVPQSEGYESAFWSLRWTTAGKACPVAQLCGNSQLLATQDFTQTVAKTGEAFVSDAFLRPVQWIIASRRPNTSYVDKLLIISPREADLLFDCMQSTKTTTLHVYRARVNSAYAPLDALDFQIFPTSSITPVVPRHIAVQLNLFAGQLYIDSYEDYLEICKFLGLLPQALTDKMERQGWKVDANGFILSDATARIGGGSNLKQSPVEFLKSLITYRRNGDGFARSDMGRLLAGGLFKREDFEKKE